jgi:hypothetical protein
MWPRTPNSAPDEPTMTMSLTTSGAMVALSPARTSPHTCSHTFCPLVASSATRCMFWVAMNTLPPATATPRLTLPQHRGTSRGIACWYCHSTCPVTASSAHR